MTYRSFFRFAHLAFAARRALWRRCSGVRRFAVVLPPLLPMLARYFESSVFFITSVCIIAQAQPLRMTAYTPTGRLTLGDI